MTQDTAAKKDTQRLQRAIIDGLEDVKAQDIAVFNTEHLSPLFERVVVASGTSNRQTKALAASVRDAVREAGFPKPRIEGEENGEWIIVDCGAAVAHIMQPAIRTYYHLEEIWGEKPVRLKFGAPKPAMAEADKPAAKKSTAKKATTAKSPTKAASSKTSGARTTPAKSGATPAKSAAKNSATKATAGRTGAKTPAKKSAVKKSVVKQAAQKESPTKAPAKKAPAARKSTSTRNPRS